VRGTNPTPPPAAPAFRSTDASFDAKFRARGNISSFATWFDDGTRARAVATLDGWLALWEREGVRYRVYPGRGAPIDHPIALSDLATGRTASPERLLSVIELVAELGVRGVAAREPFEARAPEELL
jgi:hypothetical protein